MKKNKKKGIIVLLVFKKNVKIIVII